MQEMAEAAYSLAPSASSHTLASPLNIHVTQRSHACRASTEVWRIPELVTLIASECLAPWDKSALAALACLARVNKITSSPALSVLYSDIRGNLLNLLSILSPIAPSDSGLAFTRPLEKPDWNRFLKYTRLVKKIKFSHKKDFVYAPEIFSVMDASRPSIILFPSLRSLSGRNLSPSMEQMYRFLFNLGMVCLDVDRWTPPLRLLQNIRMTSHSLKKLELGDPFPNQSTGLDLLTHNELIALVPELVLIEDISIPSSFVTTVVFDMLCQKKHLRNLRASHSNVPHKDSFEYTYTFPQFGFPSLQSVAMRDQSTEPHRHLSIYTENPTLTSFEISFGGHPNLRSVQEYMTTLSSMFTGIQDLTIWGNVRTEVNGIPNSSGVFSMLRPLLFLPRMRYFCLDNVCPMSLEDHHIDEIARAWPALEYFSFCGEIPYRAGQTQLTLSCLLSFAEHCRDLDSLTLAIDACLPPPRSPKDPTLFASPDITVNLAYSPINDPSSVAFFLADVVPRTGTVTFELGNIWASFESPRVKKWEEVEVLVKKIHKASARAVRREVEDSSVSDRNSMYASSDTDSDD
ncbi:hypothetical protein SISNIDRAFT_457243 [Sistotremastrum niveocremeum HHB9708]|uniref:F-box domain-containing protein n=1 Tax=Sistotremastrum niveocremeum HHB9708 TaxID=1314777 RepID=A0A164RUY8_9AGAM|nr:hypothetical protein SISNIDRAFT_457243 [Sistotremastrum niveocremeum HHB9708]